MPNWRQVFSGKIWQIQQSTETDGRVFERALRAPGSRLIVVKDNKILLQREKRHELNGETDIRLPGGKVFDTLEEFESFDGDIVEASRLSITKEAFEEAGMVVSTEKLQYIGVDVLGATCSWDLHYWLAEEFEMHSDGAQFHESESKEIEGSFWVSFEEAKEIVLDRNKFSESRSAMVLVRFMNERLIS
ncbi:NUDIX domain-containing protein [Candidatus Saccharibacteria bacterium]|nr:NUDIX domain-containing protein [Candidatus Saccharibacteria bacterium]